jgi:hypothetical protein
MVYELRFANADSGSGRDRRCGADSGRRGRALGLAFAVATDFKGRFKCANFVGTLEFFGTLESFLEGKRACGKDAKPKTLAHLIGTVMNFFAGLFRG